MAKAKANQTQRDQTVEYRPSGSAGFFQPPRGIAEYDPSRPLSERARLVRIELHDISTRPRKGGTWEIRVGYVQDKMALSEPQWRAARRELESAGFYIAVRLHGIDGKWDWRHLAFEDSQTPGQLAEIEAEIRLEWAEERWRARASARVQGARALPPGEPPKAGAEPPA
jgi:hypothetical protein